MRLFICWSGERSKVIAGGVRDLISKVVQSLDLFMSEEDIEKGSRWFHVIAEKLETTDAGLVCLTPENLKSEWINFECGALSKSVGEGRLYTYLHDLTPGKVGGPLSQFQHTRIEKSETLKLMQLLNEKSARPINQDTVSDVFQKCWPDFEHILNSLPAVPGAVRSPHRSSEDILEEILGHTRHLTRIIPSIEDEGRRADARENHAEVLLR